MTHLELANGTTSMFVKNTIAMPLAVLPFTDVLGSIGVNPSPLPMLLAVLYLSNILIAARKPYCNLFSTLRHYLQQCVTKIPISTGKK